MKSAGIFVTVAFCSLMAAGCGSSDPAPTVGDAEITKDMPASQGTPASAEARTQVKPSPPGSLPLDR